MDTGLNVSQESTLVVEKGNHILDYIRRRVSSRLKEVIILAPWHWGGGDAQITEAVLELLLTAALSQLPRGYWEVKIQTVIQGLLQEQ